MHCILTRSRKYDHITPILQSLHWLPIKFRISYKISLLAYKALNDLAPAYLTSFPVAQLVEHGASNAKIMGSIPRESKS